MKFRNIFITAMILALGNIIYAQEFGIGFKTGMNFNTFMGPSELDDNGNELEHFDNYRGFHFGAILDYKITDIFGIKGEILYDQKGANYNYEGPSYWTFYKDNGDPVYHIGGTRTHGLFISNVYLRVPVMAYSRFGRIEISGGANIGFLLSSKARGQITYSGANVDSFSADLDFNYNKDTAADSENATTQSIRVNGFNVQVPETMGAYYSAFGNTNKPYSGIDVGLNAGLSYYLNKGLFIGLRVDYGLSDITKTDEDVSKFSLDSNREFIYRADTDRNFTIQASLGFSL